MAGLTGIIPDDVWFGPIASDLPPAPPTDPTQPVGDRPPAVERGSGLLIRLDFIGGLSDPALAQLLPFTFQAPPLNSFPINRSYPATKYDTVSGQQYSRPGVIQLETYSWQTIFTDTKFEWTMLQGSSFIPSPLVMLERLDAVGRAKTPVHLSARNPRYNSIYDVNTPALLESLNSEEHDGEVDARYVSVEFSEYRDPSIETKRRGGGERGSAGGVSAAVAPVREQGEHDARRWVDRPRRWRPEHPAVAG
jgi:hypothetical protein